MFGLSHYIFGLGHYFFGLEGDSSIFDRHLMDKICYNVRRKKVDNLIVTMGGKSNAKDA